MSEVGLVPFARVALEVSREVLPAYSHRNLPQLMFLQVATEFVTHRQDASSLAADPTGCRR